MKSRGTISKYLSFLGSGTRNLVTSLQHETEGLRDFVAKLVDYLLQSEEVSDELIQFAAFQILEQRDVQAGFRILERFPDDVYLRVIVLYARGMMGERDAIDQALNLMGNQLESDCSPLLRFKLLLLELEIRDNFRLGGQAETMRQVRSLIEKNDDLKSFEHEYLYYEGAFFYDEGSREREGALRRAMKLSREIDDSSLLGTALNSLGIEMLRYDVDESSAMFSESYEIDKALSRFNSMMNLLNNLGYVNVIVGQYDQAIEYYIQAIELAQSLEMLNYTPMMNLAVIYGNLGNVDRALKYAELALHTMEKSGRPDPAPKTEMARALVLAGRTDEAIEYVESGGEIAFETASKRELGRYYLVRGMIDREKGNVDQSIRTFKRGLRIAESIGNPYHILQILLQLAEAEAIKFAEMNQSQSAIESSMALSRMEQIAREQNLSGLSIQVAVLKSDFEMLRGSKTDARKYLEQAKEECEKSRTSSLEDIIAERFDQLKRSESRPSLIMRFRSLVRRIVVPQVRAADVPFEVLGCLLILKDAGLQVYVNYIDSRLKSDPGLVAGLITAVSSFAKELREDAKGQLQSIVHQDIAVLLEHGEFVTGALLTDKDTYQARALERSFIEAFESKFSDKLADFDGEVSQFGRADPIFESIVVERQIP